FVLGNQVSTGAHVHGNFSVSSMCFFLHCLRFQIVGIGVIQHQSCYLVNIPVGKHADVVAAEGRLAASESKPPPKNFCSPPPNPEYNLPTLYFLSECGGRPTTFAAFLSDRHFT